MFLWFVFTKFPMGPWDFFLAFVLIFITAVAVFVSKSRVLVERIGRNGPQFLLMIWLLTLYSLLHIDSSASLADRIHGLAFASFYSFAACKPPAPPKKKTRLIAQGSGV